MSSLGGLRRLAGLTAVSVAAVAFLALVPGALGGQVTGAAFTTINAAVDSPDPANPVALCKNGNPEINCNIYTDKSFVWLNGGPDVAYVGDGTYFFAVLAPGGQRDPKDGAANNLSDETLAPWTVLDPTTNSDGSLRPAGDSYLNRTFTVTTDGSGNKVLTYTGNVGNPDPADDETPHLFNNNKIRLMPYDDTTNNGGVYILAICSLKDGYDAVSPSNCKYDAFKVAAATTNETQASPPDVTKDASGQYKLSYTWDVAKSVASPSSVNLPNGSATFHYTITATHSAGTITQIKVTGNIYLTNSNNDDVTVHVTDALSDSTGCTVKDGSTTVGATDDVLVPHAGKTLTYSCGIGGSTLPTTLRNTATVTWPEQFLDNGDHLAGGTRSYTYPNDSTYIGFSQNGGIDDCATITDTFDGSSTTLGLACVGGAFTKDVSNTLANFKQDPAYNSSTRTFSFKYDRDVAAPSRGCVTKNNSAGFSTDDTNATTDTTPLDNSASVTVCRVPAVTGALTMGFWQNKNGQSIIFNRSGSNCQALSAWLQSFAGTAYTGPPATAYGPFYDLAGISTCGTSPSLSGKGTSGTGVVGYVYNVIKAANASGASMNAMLKAQMLATALDVYFSSSALGGNWINAPAPIGGVKIDLQQICKMIDGSTGTATCSGTYYDTSSAFTSSCETVNQLLVDAAARFDSKATITLSDDLWYGNVKATQELAKNTFDAINNQVAFSCT